MHTRTLRLFGIRAGFVVLCACGSTTHVTTPMPSSTSTSSAHREHLPPVAAVRPVVDTYFGTQVVDRYRWMETDQTGEYSGWLAGQNQYTRLALDRIPSRSKILEDVRAMTRDADTIVNVQEADAGMFVLRKPAGAVSANLYFRSRDATNERLVFQPSGEHSSLDAYFPSPDGSLVAVLTSSGGTEQRTLHVVRAADGSLLGDEIPRLREASLVWLPGSRRFVYTRYPEAGKADPLARYSNAEACIHTLGAPVADDKVVFGGTSFGPGAPDDYPAVIVSSASPVALGLIFHGALRELSVYEKPLAELESDRKWRKVAGPEDEITDAFVRGNELYVLSFHGADRGRVLRLRADARDLRDATQVVPESDDVLEQIRPARDGFFVLSLRRGIHRLVHIGVGGERREAPIPAENSIETFESRSSSLSAMMEVQSYVTSPVWMRWDGRDAPATPLPFNPPEMSFAGVHVERTFATSADGTQVPLTLLMPKGATRDGNQYVWLLGYGAGGYTQSPRFFPYRDAWLKRGGIWAIAHIRGGGENGAAWHRAAMGANKERSTDDYIACADQLIRDGYTTPQRLVANGRSAGAIVVGGAMTRRPELFRAAVMTSAATNMLRLYTLPVGAENAREFGSPSTKEGFEGIFKMDVVQRVRDGAAYPAVLLQTGANDPKLPSWVSGKLAARMQAASTSGRPVLMSVAANTGHSRDTAEHLAQMWADAFAFAYWQLGAPDSQPR